MFRTEIEAQESDVRINYQSKILTLGSCFSDSIGQRLADSKFKVEVNPFGTLFNPLSIFELMELSLERSEILDAATLKRDGYYLNYKFHSSFRAKTKDTLHKRMEEALSQVAQQLREADVIFITLGTAWVYQQLKTHMLVANCHKTPQKEFSRKLLAAEEIVPAFFNLKEIINQHNPHVQFVLTVSPVRHTRDTLKLNSVSKSVLRSACHYMEDMAPDVHYFPAYEIMMDDLRDYRFYEKDLIHPNEQAIDYIWEHFLQTYLEKGDRDLLEKWQKLRLALNHRAFNPKSGSHQKFLKITLEQLRELNDLLSLDQEIAQIEKQLK